MTTKEERARLLEADRERRRQLRQQAVTPEKLAELFTQWAADGGILARITEEQAADLAAAFMAGYLCAMKDDA